MRKPPGLALRHDRRGGKFHLCPRALLRAATLHERRAVIACAISDSPELVVRITCRLCIEVHDIRACELRGTDAVKGFRDAIYRSLEGGLIAHEA